MSKKNITTIKGEELPISQAKKFPNGYYKIGDINIENSGDCYKINDKFYRIETGQVIFNNSIKQYQLLTNDVILGLIENNNIGYFNRNEENKIPIIFETGVKSFAINEEILKNNLNYREQLSTGNFVHISLLSAKDFNSILKPKNEYKTSLPYDSKGITQKHSDIYNHLYNSELNPNSIELGKFLENLTFGLEFETIAGYIPERITKKLGLIPLRDGSISGLEYVTVPLTGAKGVQTIVDTCKQLEYRTKFDNSCALHLHIGGIPRTPEFILAFLKLSSWLQNDIFTLFPMYKKYNMGIKNKNYSKPYDLFDIFSNLDPVINEKNIDKNFDVIIKKLTLNKTSYESYNNNINNIEFHPADPAGNQKWNIQSRYYFNNFIPLIFGNKQTIEFRIHTPTFDYYRIIMFLLFNSLLIKFTIKYQKSILQDPDFFKKIISGSDSRNNLFSLLYFYRNNELLSKEMITMVRSLTSYFNVRKQETEHLTRQGKIQFEDNEIQFFSEINFNSDRNIKLEKSIKLDEELPHIIEENNFGQPIQIQSKRAIKSKKIPVMNTKGLIEQIREISKTTTYSQVTSWYDELEKQQMFTVNKNK